MKKKKIILFILIIILIAASFAGGYYLGHKNTAKEEQKETSTNTETKEETSNEKKDTSSYQELLKIIGLANWDYSADPYDQPLLYEEKGKTSDWNDYTIGKIIFWYTQDIDKSKRKTFDPEEIDSAYIQEECGQAGDGICGGIDADYVKKLMLERYNISAERVEAAFADHKYENYYLDTMFEGGFVSNYQVIKNIEVTEENQDIIIKVTKEVKKGEYNNLDPDAKDYESIITLNITYTFKPNEEGNYYLYEIS